MGKFPFFGSYTDKLRLMIAKFDAIYETMALVKELNASADDLQKQVLNLQVCIAEVMRSQRETQNVIARQTTNLERFLFNSTAYEPEYMTTKEAAKYLGMQEDTVRKYVKSGKLQKCPNGKNKKIRVLKSSMDEFLGKKKVDYITEECDEPCTTPETSSNE